MKNLFLFIAIFMCFGTAMAGGLSVRFSMDKAVYEGLSSTQQNHIIHKNSELVSFLQEIAEKKIPTDIQEKIANLKIKIFLTDKPGRDGLFTPKDSGEHVIEVQLILLQSNGIKALLAHELFHAIHYHLNPDELPWVREGMAQVFEFIATGDLNGLNLSAAINTPMTPLLGNYNVEVNNRAQYGHNQLYFYYLYSYCGGDQFFWKLTNGQNNLKGSFLIDAVLGELNSPLVECTNFGESAVTFEVAKLHNQIQFLSKTEKDKFFLLSSDISPKAIKPESTNELKKLIAEMPVLSSLKISSEVFFKLKGSCSNCSLFYSSRVFPYTVSEIKPQTLTNIDLILVKTQAN